MSTNDGSAGVSNCFVFKSQLQEYAQKVGLSTPVYETIKEGPSHEPFFRSTVIVNDVRYDSLPGVFNRKAAEQSAAEVALLELAKYGEMSEKISQPVLWTITTGAGTYSSSSNPDTPVSWEEYYQSIPIDRPIGQKAAKRKSKASAPSAVDMTAMEKGIVEKNIVMTKIAEAKLAECKVKEAESIPALYEILMNDVSAMDEARRENHYFCCEIIKRKLGLM